MEYFAPATPKEAESLKKRTGRGGVYLAGGTILNWKRSPKADVLIDLKNLKLDYMRVSGSRITLGAMTTIQELAENERLPDALLAAAGNFTSRNVRNMATIGGSVAGRFFVSDTLPVLLAFRARAEFFLNGSKNTLPVEEWLRSRPGLLCSIIIDRPGRQVKVRQERISAIDFPMLVTAVGFDAASGRIEEPVVAISGASARTQVLRSAATYLEGGSLKSVSHAELNRLVQKEILLTDNLKASAAVKRRFIESHVKTMLNEWKRETRTR